MWYLFDDKPSHLPTQLRDPAENGIKAYGERPSAAAEPSANRSGSNFSGSGKTVASLWIPYMNIDTVVPLRISWLPVWNKSILIHN
jgi:hypothetical protein